MAGDRTPQIVSMNARMSLVMTPSCANIRTAVVWGSNDREGRGGGTRVSDAVGTDVRLGRHEGNDEMERLRQVQLVADLVELGRVLDIGHGRAGGAFGMRMIHGAQFQPLLAHVAQREGLL